MQAILYVGHGSRVKEGNEELLTFVEKAKKKLSSIPIQESCFIELSDPSIAAGIEACINQGATEVAVVPVLLLTANHAKMDIPIEIDKAKKRYPHVNFTYGRPLGVELTIIRILKERLESAGLYSSKGRPEYDEREPVSVLLVGRGSSDPDANSDLVKISRLLWEYSPISDVDVCYIAATRPTVNEGLERINRIPNKKVFVLPYLLFTGVLMKGLQEMLHTWNQNTEKEFILCSYLGFDDELVNVLVNRIEELLRSEVKINCDACQFRLNHLEGPFT
ncbi:sirohydrochlorin chelatase [Halalkalibacter urbisdiaboli]|uniref:sirohydrochlorin chelatase n=1 Tax=Halalkalibacter urbisdiaboli TaxID=1960589 RepID=UPI000B44B416|nr:sirohydrochlorin chelatase [Halalkalibacter urbisdiaboli]